MSLDKRIAGKRIAVVGVSDEETAHLRLLMRKAESELSHAWKWDNESNADLLVVDPSTFAGQMARTRAQAGGTRCAIFSEASVPDADLVLHRPLKLVNVVEVLNRAAGLAIRSEDIVPHKDDFYFGEVMGAPPEEPVGAPGFDESPERDRRDAALGLEDLLRIDPVDVKNAARVNAKLDDATTVLGTSGPTARSEVRGRDLRDPLGRMRDDAPKPPTFGRKAAAVAPDVSRHNLRAYLEGDLLGGPARMRLPDAPSLTLDPKLRVYHTPGRLSELAPYCRIALPPSEWEPLTSGVLADLRTSEPPQSYVRLIWLYVLVHSDGKLARHLDPGGTYRLMRWIEIERDFSAYFRIASTMLQPARLHEIAAASGAAMSDVFDVVNAFDAIGLIEWQPRAPRGAPVEGPKRGLFERLKNPFGKS
ncbi:MAG: hypothetical protein ABW186_02570 [Rhodanobacteraceae bacterium]